MALFTIFSDKAMFYFLQWIILQHAFKVSGSKDKTKNLPLDCCGGMKYKLAENGTSQVPQSVQCLLSTADGYLVEVVG